MERQENRNMKVSVMLTKKRFKYSPVNEMRGGKHRQKVLVTQHKQM